ncbi:MOSC domain-containing protein [Nostocoides jenkinsii]|uniref:MOSC domain-containing protein n=1 Tax=Nostocoides jenkinsii Ben 74 TaxID=1193518 RepID=A0A077M428_9MICO|nr:hypothetical protein [Tetrasphaera jenkinsii]CCI51309.1 conserved hypothetical protein [Tetrasphaera jenkinsii Ben 74]
MAPTRSARYRTTDELLDFVPVLDAAPKDTGTLNLVVRRPAVGEREVLDVGRLDAAYGLEGDTWIERGSKRTEDGSSHPDMQLNVMSHRMVAFLADDPAIEPLAGDQLYVDLDLSEENLPAWTYLSFGDPTAPTAVIQVTDQPHTGCAKFIERFGEEAMRFVNGRTGRPRRLRGLNARVVQPGEVRPGDPVTVRRPGDAQG